MKTIIAPIDFSPVSLNAANYAADLAYVMNSNLFLLHIVLLPVIYGEIPVAGDSIDQQIANAEKEIETLKQQISVRTKGKINISSEVIAGSSVIYELKKHCESMEPSFLIMGNQGSSALEKFFLGSNTVAALKQLSCPLIVVPPDATFRKLGKIGFACDLKKVAESVPVEDIRTVVKRFDAELHIIHINGENEKNYPPGLIEESGVLQEALDELHPHYHFLNNVSIDEGLNEFAEKYKLDLLIVIPRKYGPIDRLFHHSHSRQLIIHSHLPVLAIHE